MAKPFVSTEVTGDKRLEQKLAAFPPKTQKKQIKKATKAVADLIANGARTLAPREQEQSVPYIPPGTLKKSIKVRTLKRSRVKQGHIVVTEKKQFGAQEIIYPSFVEFGATTRFGGHIQAQPFMRRSMKVNERAAIRWFRAQLENAIKEASRGL